MSKQRMEHLIYQINKTLAHLERLSNEVTGFVVEHYKSKGIPDEQLKKEQADKFEGMASAFNAKAAELKINNLEAVGISTYLLKLLMKQGLEVIYGKGDINADKSA